MELADGKTHVGGRFWLVNSWKSGNLKLSRATITHRRPYSDTVEITFDYNNETVRQRMGIKYLKEYAFHKKINAEAFLVIELLTGSA